MKKNILTVALLASVAFAGAASAKENTKYVRADMIYGGFSKFDVQNEKTKNTKTKGGKGFAGSLGFGGSVSNSVRVEAQVYFDGGQGIRGKLQDGHNTDYKVNSAGIMANAYYDFKNSTPVTPYVMAGLGSMTNVHHFNSSVTKGTTTNILRARTSATSFAGQLGLGAEYKINNAFALDAGYRFMQKSFDKKSVSYLDGQKITFKMKPQHQMLVGVRYSF